VNSQAGFKSGCSDRHPAYNVFSAWKTVWSTRIIVCVFVGTSLFDVTFTYLLVDRMGAMGEVNLMIRWFFELNILPIWACMAVFASFLCGAILGSSCIVLKSRARIISVLLFSTAISTRVGTNFYMATLYLGLEQFSGLLLPIGLMIFILTWKMLGRTRRYEDTPRMRISIKPSHRQGRRLRIMMVVGALVLIPLATLGFLQVLMSISGVENLPRWLRSLGVVTELQGRLFLVGIMAIIVMIAAMIYAVITLFEFLGRKNELEKITNK